MYKLLRSFLFLFDAEKVHYFSMNSLKFFCKIPFIKKIISNRFNPASNYQLSAIAFPASFKMKPVKKPMYGRSKNKSNIGYKYYPAE